MSAIQHLITEHLDIWTAADTGPKSGRGRSSANAASVYGIRKLRELILELAVRGKLVPQDASDEPASELLKRIQIERGRLVAEGTIRKGKPLPPITGVESLPALPQGWEWTSLATVALINPRNNADDNLSASFVPMTMIGATFKSGHEQELRSWKEIKQGFTHFAEGDIGVAKITPCFENSKACVFSGLVNGIGAGTTELHIVRPIAGALVPRYVLAYLKSPQFLLIGETMMTGTAGQKRLPKEFVESNPFPLPPLPEQHRIVTKVDELMALCDQLESEHNNATEAHEKLVSHLLGTLTQSQSAEDFSANWQRIATHFDPLFTTEASIDALKQTLLQLAVMGKLVPQDPNDEPASELFKRIQAEKSKLFAEGKIKKHKQMPPIADGDMPFDLPKGWEWIRVSEVSELITSGSRDWAKYLSNEGAIFVTMGNLSRGSYALRLENMRYVNPPKTGEGSRTRLEAHDLLISITGDVGNLGRIPEGFGEAYINQHTCLVRFLPLCRNRYFPEVLRSPIAVSQFNAPQRGVKNSFRLGDVDGIAIPLPPVSEQIRIVAKIDELMALCDHIKSRLIDASQLQQKLADVMVGNAVSANVQPVHTGNADAKPDQAAARTLLATEVVHQLNTETRMGRVKLQKVVNLAEYIANLREVASEPMRNAAGPHDRHFMDQVLQGMKDRQWYEEQPVDGGNAYRYRPLAKAGQHRVDYEALWSPEQRRKISDLIALMRSWKTDQCERVATLYSAWNDLLIEGKEATEANILNEVLNRWNDSKHDYTKAQWQTELAAMKMHALLIPTGFGARTIGGTQTLQLH